MKYGSKSTISICICNISTRSISIKICNRRICFCKICSSWSCISRNSYPIKKYVHSGARTKTSCVYCNILFSNKCSHIGRNLLSTYFFCLLVDWPYCSYILPGVADHGLVAARGFLLRNNLCHSYSLTLKYFILFIGFQPVIFI